MCLNKQTVIFLVRRKCVSLESMLLLTLLFRSEFFF